MKQLLKITITTIALSLALFSCSSKDELINQDDFGQNDFNQKSFIISAKYENIIIGQENDEKNYSLFINKKLRNKIIYKKKYLKSSESDYILKPINDNTVRIVNPADDNEYYELRNVIQDNALKTFDIYSSTGKLLRDVELNFHNPSSTKQSKCPWCWVVVVKELVEAYVDSTNDSECETAIKQCVEAGGLPSTSIDDGLFSSRCEVKCNAKANEN